MTQSKDRSASTGSGFGGALRRILRTGVLLLVLLLVASIGLVIGRESPGPEPSATELALSEGSTAAQALAATAAALAGSNSSGDGAGYDALADMLQLHAVALRPAGSTDQSTSPAESPSLSSSPSPSVSPIPPSPIRFLADLKDAYTHGFAAAATVEPGPARVFASTATAQWLQARALAGQLDTTVPGIPVPALEYDDEAPPDCPTEPALEPQPGLEGARTAVIAEQRASYAYEVIAARATEPGQLLQRMAEHENAAALGSVILTQECVAEPLPAAAYALEDRFLSDPDAALRELENGLVGTYTDLVGTSAPGPVRKWALRQLTETAQRAIKTPDGGSVGAILPAFPGIDPGEYPRLAEADS